MPATARPEPPRRSPALAITLALAVALALVGVEAVRAGELLQHAMHVVVAPSDIARATCTAFTSQNYALLTQQIDPTPVPPANSDAFNPAAVQTQLRSIDKIEGPAQHCEVGQFTANGTTGQYSVTLQRANHPGTIALVLILRQQRDGSWRISRETNLAGTPAP